MLGSARREIPVRRILSVLGWLVAALYLGIVLVSNYLIVTDLYYPEGPWPGWWPLVEANMLYGCGGILVVLLVRLAWRRLDLSRQPRTLRSRA